MNPLARMHMSLQGLSVGDALGERFFGTLGEVMKRIQAHELPPAPWTYTDDTEMALSIVETLARHGRIDGDDLAANFVRRFHPWRGYGAGARHLLSALHQGKDWHEEAPRLFGGSGSYGNGAAMRVAPLGAYFADDLAAVRENAILSAQVTHTHREGIAGAVAVAIAAALACRIGEAGTPSAFLEGIVVHVPAGETRRGIERAANIPCKLSPREAARQLGAGERISAPDTVPFALWCAAGHRENYLEAFWTTVSGLGDRDTTCAIVGSIVALSAKQEGIPAAWIEAREPLEGDVLALLVQAEAAGPLEDAHRCPR
jgi:ADP-ribosylglycohydrolase